MFSVFEKDTVENAAPIMGAVDLQSKVML